MGVGPALPATRAAFGRSGENEGPRLPGQRSLSFKSRSCNVLRI